MTILPETRPFHHYHINEEFTDHSCIIQIPLVPTHHLYLHQVITSPRNAASFKIETQPFFNIFLKGACILYCSFMQWLKL